MGRNFKTRSLSSGRATFMKVEPFVNDVARIFRLKTSQHLDGFSLARSNNQSGMSQKNVTPLDDLNL